MPVYELLGGKLRDKIWCYGRWDGPSPESAAEFALSQVATGLTALKGDPFDHRGLFISYEAERKAIDTLAAVRDAVGFEVELLVEVHGRLTPAESDSGWATRLRSTARSFTRSRCRSRTSTRWSRSRAGPTSRLRPASASTAPSRSSICYSGRSWR